MNFLERDLENIIYQTSNILLNKRGLDIYGFKKRQVNIGAYGIADLVTYHSDINIDLFLNVKVWELKRSVIDMDSLNQGLKYVAGVKRYLKKHCSFDCKVSLVLVGKNFGNDSLCFLPYLTKDVELYTYDYNFDGIKFEKHKDSWRKTDEEMQFVL